MRLGASPSSLPVCDDVAAALAAAADRLGQRPAVTTYLSDNGGSGAPPSVSSGGDGGRTRTEQGFASLRQWAAKGAHWLGLEQLLEPGDVVGLVAPPGWPGAAVCLGAWWSGMTVALEPRDETVTIAHEDAGVEPADTVIWVGDAFDGSPTRAMPGEAYVEVVQTFPDDPPAPQASPEAAALLHDGRTWTQRELLTLARDLPGDGPLGIEVGTNGIDPVAGLVATALRPLTTGRPTVVLRGVEREAAAAERVAVWL